MPLITRIPFGNADNWQNCYVNSWLFCLS